MGVDYGAASNPWLEHLLIEGEQVLLLFFPVQYLSGFPAVIPHLFVQYPVLEQPVHRLADGGRGQLLQEQENVVIFLQCNVFREGHIDRRHSGLNVVESFIGQ